MSTSKHKSDLASKLSLLAVGHMSGEELAEVESKVIDENTKIADSISKETDSSDTRTGKSKRRSSVLKLVEPEYLDLSSDEDIEEYFEEALNQFDDDDITDLAGNVDLAIDVFSDPEADLEYKSELIGAGRKYARTTTNGQGSEVTRAFAAQESAIFELLKDINSDKIAIDKDLAHLRSLRTRNYKAIAELQETKATLYGHRIQGIKELNNMAKVQFDIKAKIEGAANNDGDAASARALQNIFSMGRRNMIDSVSSGSASSDDDYNASGTVINGVSYSDDDLDDKFSDDTEISDGDLFLKYENVFDTLVVEFDEDNNYTIHAEDKDGNVIPDYPLPNPEGLSFTINKHNSIATDQLQRRYRVRNV